MIKKIIIGLMVFTIAIALVGCGSINSSSIKSSSKSRSSNSEAKTKASAPPQENNNNTSNMGGKKGNGAGGFNMDNIVSKLKSAGIISGDSKDVDISSIELALEAKLYNDNVMIIKFDYTETQKWMDIASRGTITYNGKTHEIAMWGEYGLVFLDGKMDQDAVKVFRSV